MAKKPKIPTKSSALIPNSKVPTMSGPSSRTWMYSRKRPGGGVLTEEFIEGVRKFDEFARSQLGLTIDQPYRCPCAKCKHLKFKTSLQVKDDLYRKGFVPDYWVWVHHGEVDRTFAINPPEPQCATSVGSSSAGGSSSGRKKQVISATALGFNPWKVVSDYIGSKWQLHYTAPWPTYRSFPQTVKDLLWIEFQATFAWEPTTTVTVHYNYEKILSRRITEMWNRAKKKGDMQPEAWVKPGWMSQEIWDGLVSHWMTPAFQARALRMRRNRRSDPEGLHLDEKAPVTHVSGARPFSENRRRFVDKYHREPTFEELYKWNHWDSKRNDWEPKHGQAWKVYQNSLHAYMATHDLTEPPDNSTCSQLWVAANMDKSGRVYGFGDDYTTVRKQAGQPTPRIMRDPSSFPIIFSGCDPEAFRRVAVDWLNKLSKVDKAKVVKARGGGGDDDDDNDDGDGDDDQQPANEKK